MIPHRIGLVVILAAACNSAGPNAVVTTVELAPPEDTVSAFEPFAVVDPLNPDRVVVGAQYGPGYNRGGLRIWGWSSRDGGRTWQSGRVVPKVFPPEGQALAADLTMGVGPDGTIYHLSLTSDSAPTGLLTAGAALAVSTDGGRAFTPRLFFGAVELPSPGVMVFTDKSWLVSDHRTSSPHRGNLYISWSRNRVEFGQDTTVTTSPALAVSTDGGKTLIGPMALADSGFGTELALAPDGTLHAVWTLGDHRVLHRSSADAGKTLGPIHQVAAIDSPAVLELPRLSIGPEGRLLVCWTQGSAESNGTAIRCATSSSAGESWTASSQPENFVTAFPALASTTGSFWLLGYAVDSTGLHAQLWRSENGTDFEFSRTLASRPLSADGFCPRAGLPCRRSGTGFFPGDYVTLGSGPSRLVAAYVLPRSAAPGTSVVVSVIDP